MTLRKTSANSFFVMFVVGTIFIFSDGIADITCPKLVTIEKGNTATVSCNIEEKEIIRVYWYKGDTAKTNPILRLENGEPGGTHYGRSRYNISRSGAMIITNAQIIHEAFYTTLMYFHDGSSLSRTIGVNITISPFHRCPLIDVCVPCEECFVAQNGTGKLTCTIGGVRPMIAVKWIVKTQNGIGIVKHPAIDIKDNLTGTWNSSAGMSYKITSCNQEATLQCVAKDHFSLLEHTASSVRIYTANCTKDISEYSKASSLTMTIAIVCVVIITTAALVIFIFIPKLRRNSSRRKAHRFASQLKDKYKDISLLGSLQLENNFEVGDLYVNCRCTVTHKNGDTSIISSDKLLKSIVTMDETCVLLTGVISYWETLFMKPFIKQWILDDNDNFIVLFINKREIKASVKLIDILRDETSLDGDLLIKFISKKECVLLLHGLANIIFDGNETDGDRFLREERANAKITVENLTFSEIFKESGEIALNKVHIIVTTLSEETMRGILFRPHAKINTSHVEQRQFDEFVEKLFYHSININRQPQPNEPLLDKADNNTAMEQAAERGIKKSKTVNKNSAIKYHKSTKSLKVSDKQTYIAKQESMNSPERNEQHKSSDSQGRLRSVKHFLEKSQFYTEFMENPIALSVLAYIVMNKFSCQTADNAEVNTPTVTKKEIVCTLVKSLQDADIVKRKDNNTSNIEVHEVLGKLALHLIATQSKRIDRNTSVLRHYECELNVAIEMGLLQYSIDSQGSHARRQSNELSQWHCVEFSVTFLHYFVASYIVQNELYYTGKFQGPSVIEFMEYLAKSPVDHYIQVFRNLENDDEVIDYLHKWDDKDRVETVVADMQEKELQLTNLNVLKHREAFASFCKKCFQMKIKLKSLSISGEVALPYLRSLNLPLVEEIKFCRMPLEEEVFVYVLEWMSTMNLVLRFLNCIVPEKFSEKFKTKIRSFRNTKLKTIRQHAGEENTCYFFNYETADWKKEET